MQANVKIKNIDFVVNYEIENQELKIISVTQNGINFIDLFDDIEVVKEAVRGTDYY